MAKSFNRSLMISAVIVTLLFTVFVFSCGQGDIPAKLVVVIAVDQMRADFLDRFGDLFSGGLKYLIDNGAVFSDARQDHAFTLTGPGHSTILTGLYPSTSGIIGNDWYDMQSHSGMYCVNDPDAAILNNAPGRGVSFMNVQGTALGDWLKAEHNTSKVYSIARKDRAAVLMGGKNPDGVFWYGSSNGTFITSTAYMDAYPLWMERFNEQKYPDSYAGKTWDRYLPDEQVYLDRSRIDDFFAENRGRANVFPHQLGSPGGTGGRAFYTQFYGTPWMGEYLVELAKTIITEEKLGADEIPDMIALGFSEPDGIGHSYGPFSQEVMDEFLRLDTILDGFFNFLDTQIGLENIIIVLTSDHGVIPIPEYLQEQNVDARRVSMNVRDLNQKLSDAFGEGTWIESSSGASIYFNREVMQQFGLDYQKVEQYTADEIRTWDTVESVYTRSQMIEQEGGQDEYFRLYKNNFHPERSGDLFVRFKEYYLLGGSGVTATHGSPYSYDTNVPIIFAGARFVKGAYTDRIATVDIAPTLAEVLGLTTPDNIDGKSLISIVR